MLESVDLSLSLDRKTYEKRLLEVQNEIQALQVAVSEQRRATVLVFEGWDAAGKGGSIKRLTQRLDPRLFTVYGIAKPTQDELDHHYLWRFWNKLPVRGSMVVFDRSWYGRVLVERVEGFATEPEWQRAYDEINDFEKLLSDDGTIVLKFWLHISPEEQLYRFERRLQDPTKRWKMNEEDWRNRAKWDHYITAIEDMLARTNTPYAPWTVVEGNDKHWARIRVIEAAIERFKVALGERGLASVGESLREGV